MPAAPAAAAHPTRSHPLPPTHPHQARPAPCHLQFDFVKYIIWVAAASLVTFGSYFLGFSNALIWGNATTALAVTNAINLVRAAASAARSEGRSEGSRALQPGPPPRPTSPPPAAPPPPSPHHRRHPLLSLQVLLCTSGFLNPDPPVYLQWLQQANFQSWAYCEHAAGGPARAGRAACMPGVPAAALCAWS